jgi:hypothetical protein
LNRTHVLLTLLILLFLVDIALRLAPPPPAAIVSNTTPAPRTVQIAFQCYQHGYMIWRADRGIIYALAGDSGGQAWVIDNYVDLPEAVGNPPNDDLLLPESGFGRVWAGMPTIRAALGWATTAEQGYESVITGYASRVVVTLPVGSMDISYRGYFSLMPTSNTPLCPDS